MGIDTPGQVRDLDVLSVGPDGTWAVVSGTLPGGEEQQPGGPIPTPVVRDIATGGEPVRIVEQRTTVLDDRTHTPTEVHLAPDGTLLAPATIVGPSPREEGAAAGLWVCAPDADTCELVALPFGDRSQVTLSVTRAARPPRACRAGRRPSPSGAPGRLRPRPHPRPSCGGRGACPFDVTVRAKRGR